MNTFQFDFGDGHGEVTAHRHSNGGGTVADSADVSESAFVGPDSHVSGDAVVRGGAEVHFSHVMGCAVVDNNAVVAHSTVGGDVHVASHGRCFHRNAFVGQFDRNGWHTVHLEDDNELFA